MTPSLRPVYDELLRRAATEPHRAAFEAQRQAFRARTQSAAAPELDDEEARIAAACDDALTAGGLAALIAPTFEDPEARALSRVIARAQRGLFQVVAGATPLVVRDACRGGEFSLVSGDDVGLALRVPGTEPSFVDGRIVAASDGCAFLSGAIFHPADATPLVLDLIDRADRLGLAPDELCDALLCMNHVFLALPRVKISFAYKMEMLRPASARTPEPVPANRPPYR